MDVPPVVPLQPQHEPRVEHLGGRLAAAEQVHEGGGHADGVEDEGREEEQRHDGAVERVAPRGAARLVRLPLPPQQQPVLGHEVEDH